MKWHIECKYSGKGRSVDGTVDDAIRAAWEQCSTDASKWTVWLLPANLRMVEVTLRGCCWTRSHLQGGEVKVLMRRHHKTIAGLAFRMGITQRRIREVREAGIRGVGLLRDWLEAITEEDIGPLPERYRIRNRGEECECGECGCPLFVGDAAFEYVGDVFCSVTCCRKSRGWTA